jgi:hypothetical protein
MKKTQAVKDIVHVYFELLKRNRRIPTVGEMQNEGVTRDKIRHHCSNITSLHKYIEKEYSEELDKYIVNENMLFTKKNIAKLAAATKSTKRFIITTAVADKDVDESFYRTIKTNYCVKQNAELIILPSADVFSRVTKSRGAVWSFDPLIKDEHFVFSDIMLNDNLFLNSIKMSAKHINPLTGLSRIGQRNGSFIYASPKQALEYVATSVKSYRMPHALMTTGAITVPNYNKQMYMSERTSYIAENDHIMGAIIVEIVNNKTFHFRQIQAETDGSFIDLGIKYFPDGSTKKVETHLIPGDWHSGATDKNVIKGIGVLTKDIDITNVVLHDFFDGYCINHHDVGYPLKIAKKFMGGYGSLQNELEVGSDYLNWFNEIVKGKTVVVKSNHDEFLTRYLENGYYTNDPTNHYICLDLARKHLENEDVLKYAYETYGSLKKPENIIWLSRDEDFHIGNVQCGQHGDLGGNGSKGSLQSIEKAYGNCVVGHVHSAAILRGVFRVGTSSKMNLDYNRGPSSWTHTACLTYNNGSRQLINFIDGEYKLDG